jgi:flagellar motor switch protein FliM
VASNVSTEEIVAILAPQDAGARAAGRAAPRDFRRPRRLSTAQVEHLRRQACKSLPALESLLRASLRGPHKVEVAHLGEVDAHELATELQVPFSVVRFECAGQACWAVWDLPACIAVTEVVLGATQAPQDARRKLSSVEAGVAERWIARFIAACTASFGLESSKVRLTQTHEDLALDVDLPRGKDPQRIALTLSIEGPGCTGTLRLLIAGIKPPELAQAAAASSKKPASLPAYLAPVRIELSARLGSAEIPLAEVLALEVGDVIPLGSESERVLEVLVQGRVCATALLGQDDGRMALRIESARPPVRT